MGKTSQFRYIVIVIILQLIMVATSPRNYVKHDIDFGKLELKTELLKGTRWAIEQLATGNQIEVFYSIEIVDISKVDVDTMSIR
jgi:hypothetical protein